jgi:K319-like protein
MQRSVREPRVHAAVCILAMALACGKGATAPATATIQAEAGPDQAVSSGAQVTLSATVSTDPAGLPVTYAWSQASGTTVTLSGATTKNPTFTAPAVASGQPASALVFSLVAGAGTATSAPSQVTITVSPGRPPNADPVANAGPDQSVGSAATVTLNGAGSFDPDGEPLTFTWTQSSGAPVILTGSGTAQPKFTAPTVADPSPPLTLVFSLVVTDAHANSAPASVIVTVNPPSAEGFPPPPGTPPPASPNPTPLPVGGNGSNRFEMGAAQGLYLQDPAAGEPTVSGFVVVNLAASGGGLPGNAPADTVVTLNGVPLLRDPKLNGNFFRLDPAGPQPSIGWGGQMVLVATGTDPKDGKPIQRQLAMDCPKDIQVTPAPPIGSVITGTPSLHITSPSDITLNVGVPLMANIFPTVQLFGYVRATRTLAPSGAAINIAPGPLDVTVPVTPTAADAYLLDLRWPGVFILDGQTGGFCGLAKRWTYAK